VLLLMNKEENILEGCFKILDISRSENLGNDLELLNEKLKALLNEDRDTDVPLFNSDLDEIQWKKLGSINDNFQSQYFQQKKIMLSSFDNFFAIMRPRLPAEIKNDLQNQRNSLTPVLNINCKDILSLKHDSINSFLKCNSTGQTAPVLSDSKLNEVKSIVIELKMEEPKAPRSRGKLKKKEIQAKREESHKPVPKKDKLKKKTRRCSSIKKTPN